MPIQVTCANCLKRFQVSDKFAGKSGACPNCKKEIRVPDKSEEVVIHAPDDDAPKDRTGRSVLKPLMREETDVTRKGLFVTIGAIVGAIVVAVILRFAFPTDESIPAWLRLLVIGLLAAPPLVWSGYSFVREQELEPYTGVELRCLPAGVRAGVELGLGDVVHEFRDHVCRDVGDRGVRVGGNV